MRVSSETVLIFAPSGRDAALTMGVLDKVGLEARICAGAGDLCEAIDGGAGAVILAEEAVTPDALRRIAAVLEHQEPWSDLPIIVLTAKGAAGARQRALEAFCPLGNVSLVDRPVGVRTLQSTVQAAIRSRKRQYAARRVLADREALVEQLQQTIRLNETFLGILSHDLRNPLVAILTGAAYLLRLEESEAIHKPLTRISSSAERMARMIDQLLDFTRARLGRGFDISRSAVSLHALCKQVVEELELAHPDRSLRIQVSGSPEGEWDADRLSQVLSNLVANAIQHGQAGSPVNVDIDGEDHAQVVVRINNEGVIPSAALPTMFDAFRGTRERTARSNGLGLGLYITQQIVLAHGGTIEVTSCADQGTTFVVRLPRAADRL